MSIGWARERQEIQLINELASLPPRSEEERASSTNEPCGVSSDDYPELVCEYPAGHGLITEEDDDVYEAEHGAPSRGGWFSNGPADPAPETEEERIQFASRAAVRNFAAVLFISGVLNSDSTVGERVLEARDKFLNNL